MIRRLLRNEKGFTMVEMMVVMVIIAVLVAGGIKFYQGYIEKAKITKAKAQISTMQAALDIYYAENGAYPCGDELEADMLNAGLVVRETDEGNEEYAFDMSDPWGKSYLYKSTENSFYIRTGWEKKQDQGSATVLYGEGSNGTSKEPVVGELPGL
ncbi:MAG: type II secretion system protein GspG [Firmicutes bacterium]|nr:type II secretion system protein GspG [Bacillota bacterium]